MTIDQSPKMEELFHEYLGNEYFRIWESPLRTTRRDCVGQNGEIARECRRLEHSVRVRGRDELGELRVVKKTFDSCSCFTTKSFGKS